MATGISDVTAVVLYIFEALLVIVWHPGLEQDRVDPVLGVEEGVVAVHLREQLHAQMTFHEVAV